MKRFAYAAVIIIVVVLVAWLGYSLRYKGTPAGEPPGDEIGGNAFPGAPGGGSAGNLGGGTGSAGGASGASEDAGGALPFISKLRKVSDVDAQEYFVKEDGAVLVIQPSGKIVRVANGNGETVSAAPIPDMARGSFSADGERAMVTVATESGEQSSVFDFETKTWDLLPADAQRPVWGPRGKNLLYISFTESGTANITRWDLGAKNARPQIILTLTARDILADWVAPEKIVIAEKPASRIYGSAWLFNTRTKTLAALTEAEAGLMSVWNSAATKSITLNAAYQGVGGSLSLRDAEWKSITPLTFLTIPAKCAFDNPSAAATSTSAAAHATTTASAPDYLFCAIPRDAKDMGLASLPDAYLRKSLYTIDNIYRIDLGNGVIELLRGEADERMDIAAPRAVNEELFFINRFDNKLYALSVR